MIFALILSELWAKHYLSQGLRKVENLNLLHATKTCALSPLKSRHGYKRHAVTKDIHQNLGKGEETCLSITQCFDVTLTTRNSKGSYNIAK